MSKGLTALIIAACLAGMLAVGCASQGQSSGSAASGSSEASVKPMDEYRREAEKQITKDNAAVELKKIEAEINADAAAGE